MSAAFQPFLPRANDGLCSDEAARSDGLGALSVGLRGSPRDKTPRLLEGRPRGIASTNDHEDLASILVKRPSEPFASAFDAWIAPDPLTNPDAPSPRFVLAAWAAPLGTGLALFIAATTRLVVYPKIVMLRSFR